MKSPFELLERYIEGEVTPEEQKSIRQRIKNDPEFQKEYELRLGINNAIKEKNIMQLRYKLSMIHDQEIKESAGTVYQIFRRNWHLAAASITILILVGSLLISNLNEQGPDNLFKQYYSPDAIFTARSSELSENLDLTTGLQKFQKQNYTEAINLLKNVSDNTVSDYYLGISYIETNQFLEAKNAFHKITQKDNNLFTEQAEWYKGLCLLKLKELTEAKELFTSISMSSSIYNQNAKEILKELK